MNKVKRRSGKELCLGEYAVSIKGKDLICIPQKWRRFLKGSLWCVYCKDTEYSYLRLFFSRKSLDNFLEKLNNQKEVNVQDKVKVVSCSLHRTFLLTGLLRLPETFLTENKNSEVFLTGVMDCFEVWKKNDWYAMTEKAEEELQGYIKSFE